MKSRKQYETPEIDITRFEISNSIMTVIGGEETSADGDVVTVTSVYESETSEDLEFDF